jgi:hypothetical protein
MTITNATLRVTDLWFGALHRDNCDQIAAPDRGRVAAALLGAAADHARHQPRRHRLMELELPAHVVELCTVCVQRLAQSSHGRRLRLPTVKTKGVIEAPWVHSHHLLTLGAKWSTATQ